MFELIPWRRHDVEAAPARSGQGPWGEMNTLFDRIFGNTTWPEHSLTRPFVPALDVSENDEEFVVKAELPGIDPKQIDVNLIGHLLTIKGEKKEEKEEKEERFSRIERAYGSFSRTLRLPGDVQEDKVEAHYKDGVLNLRLPKTEGAKTKSVKIQVNES